MAEVPFVAVVMVYRRDKTEEPYPATIAGYHWRSDVQVGGGPIIPPGTPIDPPVQPPLEIWPPNEWIDVPAHPIVLPDPPTPPVNPPTTPVAPHPGWNWSAAKSGWYFLYVPGEGQPGPKKK